MTLLVIDGPEKAGKTTLLNSVLDSFSETHRQLVKWTGRDPQNGLGYLTPFLQAIESRNVVLWDRSWVSEVIYGRMLEQDRQLAEDEMLGEWLYSRPLIGRGARFIMNPRYPSNLEALRDDTDLPVNPILESMLFKQYGKRWGYKLLKNDYTSGALEDNRTEMVRSAFIGLHKLESSVYVGPHRPTLTFIDYTDTREEFSNSVPFEDESYLNYFRPFKFEAINKFGYTTAEGFPLLDKEMKANPIVVIDKGQSMPNTHHPVVRLDSGFQHTVQIISMQYGLGVNRENA